jgi:hypothetical protein
MITSISEEAVPCMSRAEEACNVKMEAAGFSENSLPMYQTPRRYKLDTVVLMLIIGEFRI